jgi:hypothetical protein
MDAKEFYTLAEQLHGDDKAEVVYREVISLSYYACFHLAAPLAENRIAKLTGMGAHRQMCQGLTDYGEYNHDRLARPLARKFYQLGLKLDEARRARATASYNLSCTQITQHDADLQMQKAQSIMQLIHEIAATLQQLQSK